MTRRTASPMMGKWRIIEMGLWDKGDLDMVERGGVLRIVRLPAIVGHANGDTLFVRKARSR